MRPISVLVTAPILLSLGLGSQLAAQIAHITNAPFTAARKYTEDGGLTYSTEQLARASNGSTYVASKGKDGQTRHISIEDVPNNRRIELSPQPPSYTYRFVEVRKGGFWTDCIDSYRERLQRFQDSFIQNPDRDKPPGGHVHRAKLGAKQENGMTLFGEKDEFTLATGEKRTTEKWESDLGLTITSTTNWHGKIRVWTVTDLERVEPDSTLFEIPKQYFPHNDPLLEAKTVFVENETGDPAVKDAAESAFNNWKRMTVTTDFNGWKSMTVIPSKEKADIVAVFTNTVTNPDDDGPVPAIEMSIYAPSSEEPIFTHHPAFNPDFQVDGDPARYNRDIARRCVTALWNRIANTHIGLIGSPHQSD
jgi:hypothetical protein